MESRGMECTCIRCLLSQKKQNKKKNKKTKRKKTKKQRTNKWLCFFLVLKQSGYEENCLNLYQFFFLELLYYVLGFKYRNSRIKINNPIR